MHIKKFFVVFFSCMSLGVNATTFVVHTNGDPHSRVLAKIFFPDSPVIPSPGADGALVWKKLENNKNDVVIQLAFAAHYLPFVHGNEDYALKHDLLATVATVHQWLIVKSESTISTTENFKSLNRPVLVSSNGTACKALVKSVFSKAGVEMVYVPYKIPAEAIAALLGGHVDFACAAGSTLQHLLDAGTARAILSLTAHHGFMLTTQVFVNREMSAEARKKLLALLTRPLTDEDHAVAKKNGFVIMVKTGEEAQVIFARDRVAWRKILKVQ